MVDHFEVGRNRAQSYTLGLSRMKVLLDLVSLGEFAVPGRRMEGPGPSHSKLVSGMLECSLLQQLLLVRRAEARQ